ncbi:hypothetical protein Q5752_004417 [Cryptotrichosporon argae]
MHDDAATTELQDRLAETLAISNQKDRITAYLSTLETLLAAPQTAQLVAFGQHFTTSTTMAMVVGRRVLGSLVIALAAGTGVDRAPAEDVEDAAKWAALGQQAFATDAGAEVRRDAVDGIFEAETSGWCDEQTTTLRHLQSHLLATEEDWVGAARALQRIPLEGGSRLIADDEKLAVYMRIVRYLLECDEWGQAQTYFSRASLLVHTTADTETLLNFRLCQAKLFDFSGRLNEAAQRYHEVSFDAMIDDDDRMAILKAAVTAAVLAPAGPQRSRMLAALNRDERVHTGLPPHLSSILRKMLLDYIVRAEEVAEFSKGLQDHQKATVEGGGTVLDRAVREHNVGACSKVYDNISFDALAALLNVDADAAEVMARKMIEQGRLRAWIDQPLHLLYFEARNPHDTDADAQGTAGGLGVERVEKPVEPVSWTERWDDRIRAASLKVESIAETIIAKGLVSPMPA